MVVLLDEKQTEQLINCGAFQLSVKKTANIIFTQPIDIQALIDELQDPTSEVSRLYKIGLDRAEYSIMAKLLELSQAGDLNALKEYDKRIQLAQMASEDDDF